MAWHGTAWRRPVEEDESGERQPARHEGTAAQRLTRAAAARGFRPWQRRGARTRRSKRWRGGRGIGPSYRGGARGEATVGFGHGIDGGAARTRETALSEREPVSTYPRGAHPDSAAHGSQPEHGAGRQCH
jgi:hypothetical protein